MKKLVLFAAIAATLTFTACNSCNGNKPQGFAVESESETDSIFMLNDSTVADEQTFVFEGLMPMQDGTVSDVVLTIKALSLNDDGVYDMSSTYMDGNSPRTLSDKGESVVLIGMTNDSTAVIYELISYDSNNPRINLKMNSDSSLTRLNSRMQPASNNVAHKLVHKK